MPSRIIFCVLSVMKLESALPEISKPRPIHINNCADEANVPKRNAEFNTTCDGLTIFKVVIASDTEDSPTTDPSTITRAPATVENNLTYPDNWIFSMDLASVSKSKPLIANDIPRIARVTVIA